MLKDLKESGELLTYIQQQINKLPISDSKKTKMLKKVLSLEQMTLEARAPRIALIGRRGSGKSSVINALFGSERQFVSHVQAGTGKGKWLWYPNDEEKKIRLLDSRGLGESEKPTENFTAETPFEELKKAISEEQPDVFLFLAKAKEADARIKEDLAELDQLRKVVKSQHNYDVPVIGVITQVDELDPPYYKQLPLDGNAKKAKNIAAVTNLLKKRFSEAEIPLLTIIPVCSYIDFDEEDGSILYDMRWNIDRLASYLVDSLPDETKLMMAKETQILSVKKKVAYSIVHFVSGIASLIGAEPIPLADLPFLTALQGLMIIIIGFIADKKLNSKTAAEFITALGINVGLAFAAREGVRAIVKFIPGFGHVISGVVAGGATYGIGVAAITYFIEEKNMEHAKKSYQDGMKKYTKEK